MVGFFLRLFFLFKLFLGILKERGKKHIILKLVQPGNRGEREVWIFKNFILENFFKLKVAFYSRIKLAASQKQKNDVQKNSQNEDKNASLIVELAKFLPRFYGCRSIKLYEKGAENFKNKSQDFIKNRRKIQILQKNFYNLKVF